MGRQTTVMAALMPETRDTARRSGVHLGGKECQPFPFTRPKRLGWELGEGVGGEGEGRGGVGEDGK